MGSCRCIRTALRCSANWKSRIWDTATGQCLRTLVHEDNPPVTMVRFSPNGRYILAFTLDSSIRLWDYIAGTCKKTYQGHVNTKYSLGGAFGVGGTEGFVVSGSEDGDIVFWDVKTKEEVQRVQGHDGVVCWVDTAPGREGVIASGGMDGTVKIWVDVNEDDGTTQLNELDITKIAGDGLDADDIKMEDEDVDGKSVYGNDTPGGDIGAFAGVINTPDMMDRD